MTRLMCQPIHPIDHSALRTQTRPDLSGRRHGGKRGQACLMSGWAYFCFLPPWLWPPLPSPPSLGSLTSFSPGPGGLVQMQGSLQKKPRRGAQESSKKDQECPRRDPGKPRRTPGEPRRAPESPRTAAGEPRRAMGSPRRKPGEPQRVPGEPKDSPGTSLRGVPQPRGYPPRGKQEESTGKQ